MEFPCISPSKTVSHVVLICRCLILYALSCNCPGVLLLVGKPKVHSCMPFYLLGKSNTGLCVCVCVTYVRWESIKCTQLPLSVLNGCGSRQKRPIYEQMIKIEICIDVIMMTIIIIIVIKCLTFVLENMTRKRTGVQYMCNIIVHLN